MKVAILYNHLFTSEVIDLVGMREDGSWNGLFSSAQVETSRRNSENISLKEFENKSYGHNNFSQSILKWLENYLDSNTIDELTVFYFLPKGAQELQSIDDRVKLSPFRTRIQFEKTFKRFVQDYGWGITQLPRYER